MTELPPLQDATAAAIRLALGEADHDLQPRDWSRVFAVASAERLAVIAWLRSGELIRTTAPKQVVASWRGAAFHADDLARVQGARLCELVTSLEATGLHPVVLKGLPLGARLYGYVAARVSCDIDLYIPAEERKAAHEVVCGRGWRCWAGQAPWDASYHLSDHGRMLYLELHSQLGGDVLTHCGPLPMLTEAWEFNGQRLSIVSGVALPPYLAANLVKHTPVPLISCLDFATLWNGFDDEQRRAAYALAHSARLRRSLTWAVQQGIAVIEAARGDDRAMRRLGVAPDERRAVHGHVRLVWLADSPIDAARVLGTWLLPRPMRSSLRLARSFWSNRLRGSLSGKLIQRRSHAPNAHIGEYGGQSVIDRIVGIESCVESIARLEPPGAAENIVRSSDDGDPGDRAATQLDVLRAYAGRWAGTDRRRGAASANSDARTFNALQHLIAAGQEVWITVTGRSMEPTLRHGDRVLLRAPRSSSRSGWVVLSEFRGRVVLHRVIHADAESVTTAGDSCRRADPPVPHSAVVAEAVAVQASRGVVPLQPTLRYGVRRVLPYLVDIARQEFRRARWRLTAVLTRMSTSRR